MTLARTTPRDSRRPLLGYKASAVRWARTALDALGSRVAIMALIAPVALGMLLALWCAAPAWAQRAEGSHFYNSNMPPGMIGRERLALDAALRGYFQPVMVTAPRGTRVSLAENGQFETAQPAPRLAGLLVGYVYRLKVTNIPLNEGLEVYPTIELIDRLYPPHGEIERFPIPVDLTRQELEMALSGRYVMRVIYLEDPQTALPLAEPKTEQRHFEVDAGEDPLETAERLGRPVAILRMGSRLPDARDRDAFFFGSPPVRKYGADALKKLLNPENAPEAVPEPRGDADAAPNSAQTAPKGPQSGVAAPRSPQSGPQSNPYAQPRSEPKATPYARRDAAPRSSPKTATSDSVQQFESQFSSKPNEQRESLSFPGRIFRLATPPSESRGTRR